ncbi:MAG: signal peptidase [Pseudomonadota bacterium]|jgi:signal peptidase I
MNFALILFLASLVTGIFWVLDRQVWRHQRPVGAPRPGWLEYTAGFFPVIFVVFLVRSFLFEPFNIPSGSMIPTLRIGDLILVKKYSYGIRVPVLNTLAISTGLPQRGDVAVFRYPKDESVDYIKRIVAIPGDRIEIEGKQISVNGKLVERKDLGIFADASSNRPARLYEESMEGRRYQTLNDEGAPAFFFMEAFSHREACDRTVGGIRCTVPAGHYFAMGDNRDNSADSRIWGFVPERNLVGQAFMIWFNFGEVVSGRFDRLGFFE